MLRLDIDIDPGEAHGGHHRGRRDRVLFVRHCKILEGVGTDRCQGVNAVSQGANSSQWFQIVLSYGHRCECRPLGRNWSTVVWTRPHVGQAWEGL